MPADGTSGLCDWRRGGATFYIEPAATLDVDVFVSLKISGPLLSLSPIYNYLKARGCKVDREYIVIGGWLVQFLPPADALGEEALARAVQTELDGVTTYVMTAEHLVALAFRSVGRRISRGFCSSSKRASWTARNWMRFWNDTDLSISGNSSVADFWRRANERVDAEDAGEQEGDAQPSGVAQLFSEKVAILEKLRDRKSADQGESSGQGREAR